MKNRIGVAGTLALASVFVLLQCTGKSQSDQQSRSETASTQQARPEEDDNREHYGALMAEVGRRYELMGRAALARRWELADFELHEMEETLDRAPNATPPEDVDTTILRNLREAFVNTHPVELRKALTAHDEFAFRAAYDRASATCNGCHKSTGHAFIEIPDQPGIDVPKLDRLP